MDIPVESNANRGAGWLAANLLPMWLLTAAVLTEEFPNPPVLRQVGWLCFGAALLVIAALAVRRRLAPELLLFDLAPLILMLQLDELPNGYRTPFLLTFAGMMTVGGLVYARADRGRPRWEVAIGVLALVVFLGVYAAGNVWDAFERTPYRACFPGCVPDTFPGQPWWKFFFAVSG